VPEPRDAPRAVGATRRWSSIERWVPAVGTVRSYERRWLPRDLLAGVVLAVLLVPQGMAYAELAGLPPVYGLYTTVIALVAYAFVGPSRLLVIGPDSALGLMIAAAVLPLLTASEPPEAAVALASMLALMMGAICVAAGLLRLGRFTELLSKPVRVGYLNGIAVLIVAGQLPKLFGFSASGDTLQEDLRLFVEGLADGDTVPASLTIGITSIVIILGCRRFLPRLPGVLIAVAGAIVVVDVLDLTTHGVVVVGPVPTGFPEPSFPDVASSDLGALLAAAAAMAFVTLADTSALSRTIAARRGDRVDANQEIVALGTANVAAAFFQGFPVSASASRTALAESTGGRTQLTGIIGAVGVALVLVAPSDLLRDLPTASLAAIVMAAAVTLFDLSTLRWLWRVRRSELILSVAALLGVAILGVLEGIVVAIVLSLGNFVRRAWRPYDAVLGRIEGRKGYHDVERHPEAVEIPGLVIYRFDAPLFFANAEHFADRVREASERRDQVRWLVVAAEPMTDIDTTGAEELTRLLDDLGARGIVLAFAELKGQAKDRLRRYGLYQRIGDDRFFPTLGTAIDAYVAESGVDWVDWSDRPPDDR
jgi:high affinity sulfate transporter 1